MYLDWRVWEQAGRGGVELLDGGVVPVGDVAAVDARQHSQAELEAAVLKLCGRIKSVSGCRCAGQASKCGRGMMTLHALILLLPGLAAYLASCTREPWLCQPADTSGSDRAQHSAYSSALAFRFPRIQQVVHMAMNVKAAEWWWRLL